MEYCILEGLLTSEEKKLRKPDKVLHQTDTKYIVIHYRVIIESYSGDFNILSH